MSVTALNLFEAQYAPSSAATVYTAPSATTTIIDCLSATNVTGSPVTITVYLVPFGAGASTSNIIISAQSIAANTYAELFQKPQVLNAGDSISILASAGSSIVSRGSGREITS